MIPSAQLLPQRCDPKGQRKSEVRTVVDGITCMLLLHEGQEDSWPRLQGIDPADFHSR